MFKPENEMGVIVAFAQECREVGFEIISISSEYPDAIIKKNGKEYKTEFEFNAKSFVAHRHDPRNCDLIICWNNDFSESILPIITISESGWENTILTGPSDAERELAYWKYRALSAEARARKLNKQSDLSSAYKCEDCGKEFGTVQALSAHKRFCMANEKNGHKEIAK